MGEIMVAKHAVWPRVDDPIFNISERAQKAIKTLGKENVINATKTTNIMILYTLNLFFSSIINFIPSVNINGRNGFRPYLNYMFFS